MTSPAGVDGWGVATPGSDAGASQPRAKLHEPSPRLGLAVEDDLVGLGDRGGTSRGPARPSQDCRALTRIAEWLRRTLGLEAGAIPGWSGPSLQDLELW